MVVVVVHATDIQESRVDTMIVVVVVILPIMMMMVMIH